MLYGAIIGDICGSVYEGRPPQEEIEFFADGCTFTDDTVCTLAVANALLTDHDYAKSLRNICLRHLYRRYGPMYVTWLLNDPHPYNSYGNGSAMRVSSVAWAYNDISDIETESKKSAEVTHNHPEGIRGAQEIAKAIFKARNGVSKKEILEGLCMWYPLYSCDEIMNTNDFTMTCQKSIPAVMAAFNETDSFEDCIKTAISFGWDTDTNAAIAGSIAEAYYGISSDLIDKCKSYLAPDLLDILERFNAEFS